MSPTPSAEAVDLFNTAETIFYNQSRGTTFTLELVPAGDSADGIGAIRRILEAQHLPFELTKNSVRIGPLEKKQIQRLAEIDRLGLKGEIKLRVSLSSSTDGTAKHLSNLLSDYYLPQHQVQIRSYFDARKLTDPTKAPHLSELSRLLDPTKDFSVSELTNRFSSEALPLRVIPGTVSGTVAAEFRFPLTAGDVRTSAKRALGLVQGADAYGYFDHDRLLSELSGVDLPSIVKLRAKVNAQGRKGVVTFRYHMVDSKTVDRLEDAEYYGRHYGASRLGVEGYIHPDPEKLGMFPIEIPGESVVFHRLSQHQTSIVGKYNPALVNENIHDFLANKLVEARFWSEIAPNSMPLTWSLSELTDSKILAPDVLKKKLDVKFPGGWVLKPVWGFGTEKALVTDKTDFVAEIDRYMRSDFDQFRKRKIVELAGEAEDFVDSAFRSHPGYMGWKLTEFFDQHPDLLIVQKRVKILQEFRVEIQGRKVMGSGSTIDRYSYLKGSKKSLPPSPEIITKVEHFAQNLVDRLPEKLRETPFGMDVALLEGGKLTLIESNPGGNSEFLFSAPEESTGIKRLGEYLENYPELIRRGELRGGMSKAEQMDFIQEKIKKWKINPEEHFAGFVFSRKRLNDTSFEKKKPLSENYRVVDSPCRRLFAPPRLR